MNNKFYKYGMVFCLVATAVAIFLIHNKLLKEPIFNKFYIEEEFYEHYSLNLFLVDDFNSYNNYEVKLTNNNSKEETYLPVNENLGLNLGFYKLLNIAGYIDSEGEFEEIEVIDTKRNLTRKNIGKIILYKQDKNQNKVLKENGNSNITDMKNKVRKNRYEIEVAEDIEILSVESKLYSEIKEFCQIKLNNINIEDFKNIRLKAGETLVINSEIDLSNKKTLGIGEVNIRGLVKFLDKNGKLKEERVPLVYYVASFTQDRLKAFVKVSRRESDE